MVTIHRALDYDIILQTSNGIRSSSVKTKRLLPEPNIQPLKPSRSNSNFQFAAGGWTSSARIGDALSARRNFCSPPPADISPKVGYFAESETLRRKLWGSWEY